MHQRIVATVVVVAAVVVVVVESYFESLGNEFKQCGHVAKTCIKTPKYLHRPDPNCRPEGA